MLSLASIPDRTFGLLRGLTLRRLSGGWWRGSYLCALAAAIRMMGRENVETCIDIGCHRNGHT